MSSELSIVLPLLFFSLIDIMLIYNSFKQGFHTFLEKLFAAFSCCIAVVQVSTAISYACDLKLISIGVFLQFTLNFVALIGMTIASFLWFEYMLITAHASKKLLSRKATVIFAIPIVILVAAGVPSQQTHWLFFINEDGVYTYGSMLILQFLGYIYFVGCVVLTTVQIIRKKQNARAFRQFALYIIPAAIGSCLNVGVFRGGYVQTGCSMGLLMMYMEQYVTEFAENRRLKSLDGLNKRLQEANDDLLMQMEIVGGLSNAFFTVYGADLTTNEYWPIKGYDFTRDLNLKSRTIDEAFKAYLPIGIMPEDMEKMIEFTNWHTLDERMGKNDVLVQEFHGTTAPWEWCRASWIVVSRSDDGKLQKVLYAIEDISASVQERMKNERERERSHMLAELRLQTMTEAIHGGFKISKNDAEYSFVMVSEQLAELLGYDSAEELLTVGRSMANIVDREDAAREIPLARNAVRSGEMYTMHYRMRCKDGSWKNVEDRGRLIQTPNGEEEEFWSFIADQDELTRKAEALEAADQANAAKTRFLFNMSHDIRTPMNAIIGYTELMERHFDERDKCRDYLNKIKNSSDILLSLINNVLEMARIESGHTVLDEEVCNMADLANETSSLYSGLMKKKGIEFTVDVDARNTRYYADRVKLNEIFLNILSNAYKYTTSGGKVVMTTRELPGDRSGYIIAETKISDTGIGMSKEFLPVIFEEFSRERSTTETQIQGTGLGMPIVKKLVELMEGTIEVESELGKGTTFTIRIPHRIAAAEETELGEETAGGFDAFKGKRILLTEDNDLNAEIATEILSEYGFEIERAEDGIICIDMVSKMGPGYYDLILMDVQMPHMDGYKATENIRRMSDPAIANIPIIAMTANAFDEDRKNALAAGMNGHLGKPIEIPKLISMLEEFLH